MEKEEENDYLKTQLAELKEALREKVRNLLIVRKEMGNYKMNWMRQKMKIIS